MNNGTASYVTEGICHERTESILKEVKCVKGDTVKIDKALAVLIAEKKGKDSALDRLVAYGKIIGLLLALGAVVWTAAKLTQPDVAAFAKAVADEVHNGPVTITRGDIP